MAGPGRLLGKAFRVAPSSYFALFRPLKDTQSRLVITAGSLLAILAGCPLPIIGVIFANLIDAFPPPESDVRLKITQLLAVAIAYFVITVIYNFCWGIVGARVSRRLRVQLVERALGLDQTYYDTQCPDITSRLTVDAQSVQAGTSEKCGLFLQSVSYFVAAFVVGFILNPELTAVLLAGVVPTMTLIIYFGTTSLNRYSTRASSLNSRAILVAEGALHAVQVVQAFGAHEPLNRDHEAYLTRACEHGVKKSIASALMLAGVFFTAFATNALAFYYGSAIIRRSSHSGGAGSVYVIVFLILDASFVIGQAGPFITIFAQAADAGKRIYGLINHPETSINVYDDGGIQADPDLFRPGKVLSFKDISFAYPARENEQVLSDVSLEILTGTTIGIVGASGSGKSTFASLLMRLYDPSSGSIALDGTDLRSYNLSSLRKHISVVTQDPTIFSGTILSNICHGYRGPSLATAEMRQKCLEAAKGADALSFIENLAMGLDTKLGDPDGHVLSGGQAQRLVLATALVNDPPLLILDEATSALDTLSERAILQNLQSLRKGKTTIIIAHRLASVTDADQILVMGKGRLLEKGTHDELTMAEDGAYKKLVQTQQLSSTSDSNTTSCSTSTETLMKQLEDSQKEPEKPMQQGHSQPTEYNSGQIIRRCLHLSRPQWKWTLVALLASCVTGALIIGEALISGNLIPLLNGSVDKDRVNFFCLMFFVVALIALCGYSISGSSWGIVSEHLIRRTRVITLQTILRQDMQFFQGPNRSTAALSSIISMDSGQISGLSGVIIGTILSALISVLGGAILAHIMAWKIAIVLFATSPIVLLAGFLRLRVVARIEEQNRHAYTEAATWATEACTKITTVATLGIERAALQRFRDALDKYRHRTFKETTAGNVLLSFALAITYFVYALAYWWGSKLVRQGEYSTLDFFVVLPAILFSSQAAGQLFSLAPDLGRAKAAASRVFSIHDQVPSIDNDSDVPRKIPSHHNEKTSLKTPRGELVFRNVSMTYVNRPDTPVFTNLNLHIKAGETVALVGRSGAGKSSIVSLIERFYDPTEGTILLDGQDVRTLSVTEHRARLSLVSQSPDLFAGSVAFNVGLGAKPGHKATMEDIVDACKAVGIHDFLSSLPDGYETQCGNNGSQLSGGQKQRVAIARAYIRDPDILLLDEATSALDSHSEAQIQHAIYTASRQRTTIMVAHRLTTVQHADRILVFDRGRVVEEGRHEELIGAGGIYQAMVLAQTLG